MNNSMLKIILCTFISFLLISCASTPPKHQNNICHIFDEKNGWYKDAKKASKRWNSPIAINMAFIYQESRFVPKAKPPRKKILWIIPGPRVSSSYGYSQAKTPTWDWYRKETRRGGADRDDFDDAIDFVAWYNSVSQKRTKIAKNDAYNLYLAYHEGHGGFKRKSYNKKAWLKKVARKVDAQAKRYQQQLNKCEDRLGSSWWWPF